MAERRIFEGLSNPCRINPVNNLHVIAVKEPSRGDLRSCWYCHREFSPETQLAEANFFEAGTPGV